MVEGDKVSLSERRYKELLAAYRAEFGNIREPHSDPEKEDERSEGYTHLLRAVFDDIQIDEARVNELLPDFRSAVNDALLACLTPGLKPMFCYPTGDPKYAFGKVILTPKQGKALIIEYGLLDGSLRHEGRLPSRIPDAKVNLWRCLQEAPFGTEHPSLFMGYRPGGSRRRQQRPGRNRS